MGVSEFVLSLFSLESTLGAWCGLWEKVLKTYFLEQPQSDGTEKFESSGANKQIRNRPRDPAGDRMLQLGRFCFPPNQIQFLSAGVNYGNNFLGTASTIQT